MCGIVGILVREDKLCGQLGRLMTPMIDCMGTRGPDSAGLAVFHQPLSNGQRRFGLFSGDRHFDWSQFHKAYQNETGAASTIEFVENHAAQVSSLPVAEYKSWLTGRYPNLHVLSVGRAMHVFKDEGHPGDIARRYRFDELAGTHAVGHTRMATESAVSPAHAHPFTAGEDFCLVHNGSLSNPYSVRRKLERQGISFETDNDTEAACRFLEWRLREGDELEAAIETSFNELDGFYTFLMATAEKLVLVRDAFACKPAVVAETADYVAVASEFRALAQLPQVASAHVFEPAPQQIYSWTA